MVNKDVYKIVRTHARNVHREHGQERLDDDASRVSLGPGKRRCCVLDALGRRLVETQKNSSWNNCACLAVASKHENCRDSMSSSL